MVPGFDITIIDWNDPDVSKVLQYFGTKLEDVREQNRHSKERIVQLEDRNVQLEGKVVQLEKENRQLKEDLENAK